MRLNNLRPVLYVTDMDETIRFHQEVLGFDCVSRLQGWAAMRNSEVEIMISLPNVHVPFDKPLFTGSFYFNADDVDSAAAAA